MTNLARSATLTGLMGSQTARNGQTLAVADGALRVTWADLQARVARVAGALTEHGVESGDRVALLLLDGIAALELIAACGYIGAIALPLNWRLAPAEIAYIIDSARPKLLFHSESFTKLVPSRDDCSAMTLPDAASTGGSYELMVAAAPVAPAASVTGDSPLFMLYTSGTTGRPKGCLQSHAGAVSLGHAFALHLGLTAEDRLLSTSPLFHVGGLGHVFAALAAGAGVVFGPRGASHEDLLRLASTERCSFGSMNDALVSGLCEQQRRLNLPLAFRSVTRGSSLTPRAQIEVIGEVLGAQVVGGYGQTESLGFTLLCEGEDLIAHPSALGMPMSHVEAAVLDGSGHPIAGEAAGELGIRGPTVMLGYWNNTEATADALGTGWLRTGDLVRRDSEGRYHFEGRAKELVKTGGENVYPREVEEVLLAHPAISDAAIVGVPDERWGEAVKACVVVVAGQSLAASEVVAWCREHIAGYKRPRYVQILPAIPRDYLGKIQRPVLRELPVTPDQKSD
jgi:acyl-CoA synthetase (AMP-forming)/AMP-acid ligase II